MAVVGTHLAFDADATALAIVAADGDGRYLDTADLHPDDEAALASWLADADHTEGAARGQARDARPGRPRLDAGAVSPPTPRWPPTWCGPGSAASRSTTCRCGT